MVFSGKIYDQVKENLDTYLFGFDRSQLDVSLLKGAIKLDGVNIKPNKAEKLMQSLALPFSLKAGTVGVLEIKLNLMSRMFSKGSANAMQISLDNAFFIIGPSMRVQSRDESYLQENEQEMLYPYDDNNAFNIFQNNLKLRKKPRNTDQEASKSTESNKESSKPGMSDEQKDLLKGLTLEIKRLHLRYEDDYYSQENPYSCGIVIDELRLEASETRIFFERLADLQTSKQDLSQMGQNVENQLCKDFNVSGLRFYWNCMSEMYIPTSLWESTRHMKYQIFEAMDAQQLNEMMIQAFNETGHAQYQFVNQAPVNIRSQVHCYERNEQGIGLPQSVSSFTMQIASPIDVHLNPFILNDMQHFIDRMQNQWLLKDLKQYRPHRRPLTDVPKHLENRVALRRKRKLIVRDWFFFVVWYIRLRRIITEFYKKDDSNAYLLFDSKYSHLLHSALNKECSLEDLVKKIRNMASNDSKNSEKQESYAARSEFNMRMQSLNVTLFQNQLFEAKTIPKLSMQTTKLALSLNSSESLCGGKKADQQLYGGGIEDGGNRKQEEKFGMAAQLGSLELNTFSTQPQVGAQSHSSSHYNNPYHQGAKPKQLSQMYIKQDVLVQGSGSGNNDTRTYGGQNNLSTHLNSVGRRQPQSNKNASFSSNQLIRNEYYHNHQQPQSTSHKQHFSSHTNLPYRDQQTLNKQDMMHLQMPPAHNANFWNDADIEDRHMPNITSPGRATMIGPKVNSDQVPTMQQPRNRQNQNGNTQNRGGGQQKDNEAKRGQQIQESESKDSLVSNMLQSMSRFLSGGSNAQAEQKQTVPVCNIRSDSEEYGGGGVEISAPPSYNSHASSYNHSMHTNQQKHAEQAAAAKSSSILQSSQTTPTAAQKNSISQGLKGRNPALSNSHMNLPAGSNRGRGRLGYPGGGGGARPQQQGLDQLLRKRAMQKSGAGDGPAASNNNSFYRRYNNNAPCSSNNMQTESSNVGGGSGTHLQHLQHNLDMSTIVGSNHGGMPPAGDHYIDDELLMQNLEGLDSVMVPNRGVNHMQKQSHISLASSSNNYPHSTTAVATTPNQRQHATQIQDGIRNKNFINQPYSPSRGAGTNNQIGSTLGRLLNNQSFTSGVGALNQQSVGGPASQKTSGRLPYNRNTSRSPIEVANQQSLGGCQNQIVMADTTCNVLPTTRINQQQVGGKRNAGASVLSKERLLRVCTMMVGDSQPSSSQQEAGHYSGKFDYKLVHVDGMAREVSGELLFGRVEVSYSHNALVSLQQFLLGIKGLPMFRDLNIVPACMLPKKKKQITPETVFAAKENEITKNNVRHTLASLRETMNQAPLSQDHKKLNQVGQLIQQCLVDLKVQGERIYISLFDDQSHHQLAKFVSPPISLAMLAHHPRQNPGEASYEVFGFQAQQSTDLNLLGNFAGLLVTQAQFFAQNETLRRGQACYDEIFAEYRRKEEEKRIITQQIMRKQSLQLQGQISTGMLNDFTSLGGGGTKGSNLLAGAGSEGTTGRGNLGPTKPPKITAPSLAQGRSKVRKPHVSRSGQAMQPGSHKKQQQRMGKQMSANYNSSNSKMFSNLKKELGDERPPKKVRAGANRVKKIDKQRTMMVMPGNGLAGLGNSDDYDDVPEPKDCQDETEEEEDDQGDEEMMSSSEEQEEEEENAAAEVEDEDDALLRDKRETDMSDEAVPSAPPAPMRLIKQIQQNSQKQHQLQQDRNMQQHPRSGGRTLNKSSSYQNLDTICQVDDQESSQNNNHEMDQLDIQDLKSPSTNREFVVTERVSFSNSRQDFSALGRNLQVASAEQCENARLKLGGGYAGIGNPIGEPAHRIAENQFELPMKSNTNTDSAGGEAFDNNEEDVYKMLHSQPAKRVPCDQDEPLLHTGHESYFKSGNNSSENKSQQSGKRQMKKNKISESGSDTNNWSIGIPMLPRASEETKKWKNTKDSINMQKMMRKGGTGQNCQTQRHNQLNRKDSGSLSKGSQGNKMGSNRLFNYVQQNSREQNDASHEGAAAPGEQQHDQGAEEQFDHINSKNGLVNCPTSPIKTISPLKISARRQQPKKLPTGNSQSQQIITCKQATQLAKSPQRKKAPFQP